MSITVNIKKAPFINGTEFTAYNFIDTRGGGQFYRVRINKREFTFPLNAPAFFDTKSVKEEELKRKACEYAMEHLKMRDGEVGITIIIPR